MKKHKKENNKKKETNTLILDTITYSSKDTQVISTVQSHLEWNQIAHLQLVFW